MPDPRVKPVSASESSASDEASKLELYLQRQLEEDVASDAYTECDITTQEKEILIFLKKHVFTKSNFIELNKTKDEIDDIDVFLTPNCTSPLTEKKGQQISCLSPSTEITKEYYALVHIEGNLLEQELIEQDVLSNAFQTIKKSQESNKVTQRNKPTSLSLISSHSPKTIKHSNDCDIHNKLPHDPVVLNNSKFIKKAVRNDSFSERNIDPTYSPDSLITDEPSSSSDYLSAVYTCSPALGSSGCLSQLNAEDSSFKMENIFTSSDSGLENTGLLESLNSHKDVTLTDISLSDSTVHDRTVEEGSSPEADVNQVQMIRIPIVRTTPLSICTTSQGIDYIEQKNSSEKKSNEKACSKSSKEQKQRQNEEIVILESSSVSSETGSWESVFPPKLSDKEACDKFIQNECQNISQNVAIVEKNKQDNISDSENFAPFLVKTTPCFIDAASLVDEEHVSLSLHSQILTKKAKAKSKNIPVPSQPVPCSTIKGHDISPGDWSESNDNEDSLEQADNKEPDSIQKDLSPTIFEMTPITEDSLSANDNQEYKEIFDTCKTNNVAPAQESTSAVYMGTTPHNSIMSLKGSSLKNYDSEESESDTIVMSRESLKNFRSNRYNESPLVSDCVSLENISSPKLGTQSSSPSIRKKIDNIFITTESLNDNENKNSSKQSKSASASAWVVDMSLSPKVADDSKSNSCQNVNIKKPSDRTCATLKNELKVGSNDSCNKSRSSVDSDSSEKSGHKFYIDLSTLPDPLPPETTNVDKNSEKGNIFSMYIDLGEKSTLKEMPSRLSSSLNAKKQSNEKTSTSLKHIPTSKTPKNSYIEKPLPCSSKTNDQSVTFERYESLCNDPNISISDIIAIPEPTCRKSNKTFEVEAEIKNDRTTRRKSDKSFKPDSRAVIREETTKCEDTDLFVRLSDLDKPIQNSDDFEREIMDARMTRSIPDNNWSEQNKAGTSRSSEVISSFHSENALSLNRLFPHLKNEFSKSMPISLSGRTQSPSRQGSSACEVDEHNNSDVSELSSVQSSMCRSVIENSTTEETSQTSSLIGNCQSRLGQDLLRMFLEEIAPDVIVEVSGKRIKAHKCILSSRCQYFAGILSGGWVESSGNVIVLPPFSFNVVHFALCHIYSGLSNIPDSISIVELATIADMLGLEGLKEAIMFTLKARYCHHFHRPCQVCTAGVLECFPLSSVYGLDDLYRKCLRWITKYFTKVWPTKAFATLPKELLDKCYQEHIINLTIDNLIDTVYGCGITVASLQNSRWAESVARMCRRLVNAAAHFAAPRLLAVLEIVSTAPDAHQSAKQALDDCLAAAIEWAPPDETCRVYAFLSHLVKEMKSQNFTNKDFMSNGGQTSNGPELSNFLFSHASCWRLQCEGALVRAAPRVVGTQAFKDLPTDLRRRLRELGCIMYGPQAIPLTNSPLQDRKSKSAYQSKPSKTINSATTRSLDMEKVRNSFVPYKPKPIVMGSKDKLMSSAELRDIKKIAYKANMPKVRTTKAQEERAKFNQTKTLTSQDRSVNNKPGSTRMFENTKPRYLEPRLPKEKEKKMPPRKLVNKMVSSSESSRNSSPIQSRNVRASRITSNQIYEHKTHTMSQDSLATSSRPRTAEPSTDSLSGSQNSNKYATYTKTKHTGKGSVESVIPKSQGHSTASLLHSKIKTKIPVYYNQNSVSCNGNNKSNVSAKSWQVSNALVSAKSKSKTCERKVSGSLMNATKSSSAKIVPKVTKESQSSSIKSCKQQKHAPKNANNSMQRREDCEREQNIPAMERSGTFLKDEPMFSDKSADMDKGQ
ncbi:uncharacterized protein LOC124542900 isoform X2 [Vanessa cardui]|uniref:uncharacterized protein LOC124542900 isoform X2 n=1 Tax=Vanessa cardui TaxID=171605 RepID=UPI001F13967A|nr:uncharacterized protein LOC124542900 isoform X2 [Vanessa cardui]